MAKPLRAFIRALIAAFFRWMLTACDIKIISVCAEPNPPVSCVRAKGNNPFPFIFSVPKGTLETGHRLALLN